MNEKQLLELLDKKFLTIEEMEEVEQHEEVLTVESCGCSGQYFGYNWYIVTLQDKTEYSIYN